MGMAHDIDICVDCSSWCGDWLDCLLMPNQTDPATKRRAYDAMLAIQTVRFTVGRSLSGQRRRSTHRSSQMDTMNEGTSKTTEAAGTIQCKCGS